MEKNKQPVLYEKAQIEITRFEEGDCISTSDMNFSENESWNNNIPNGGWV